MNSENFVDAVKRYVRDPAIEGTISQLKKPSGRGVAPEKRARSDWYNNLSTADARHVNDIIDSAVHAALFGLFVVLDGDRKISDDGGRFELTYVADKKVLLNDPRGIGLHDLLNSSN